MMTDHNLERVREFHKRFGVHTGKYPGDIPPSISYLRADITKEEALEVEEEIYEADRSLSKILKELCDLQYVLDGTFLAFGFDKIKDKAMAEVHRSNMSKLGEDGQPIYREDGKVLKGPKYFEPDMEQFFE